ncbi:MAG: V-type ATP synthase subunit F [Thermoplasmata archaeon]|nr:V-type ATP synthase subunit F [Thermoplasmata archaeon]
MADGDDIVVVGSSEFITGFRLAGVRSTIPVDRNTIEEVLLSLLKEKRAGILVLHDDDVRNLPAELRAKLWQSVKPVVVAIGSEPEKDLRDKIKRTLGVDLYREEKK